MAVRARNWTTTERFLLVPEHKIDPTSGNIGGFELPSIYGECDWNYCLQSAFEKTFICVFICPILLVATGRYVLILNLVDQH